MSGVLITRFSLPPRLSLIFLWNSLKHVIYFIVSHTLDLADTAPWYHKVFLCSSVSHNWWLETWPDFNLIGVEGQAQEISKDCLYSHQEAPDGMLAAIDITVDLILQ